jgi:hypothetical protein
MKKFLLAFSIILLNASCSLFAPVQDIKIVKQFEYVTCDIPDKYFIQQDIPYRNWDWNLKKESDALNFVQDLIDTVTKQNDELSQAQQIYNNCKKNTNNITNNKGTN